MATVLGTRPSTNPKKASKPKTTMPDVEAPPARAQPEPAGQHADPLDNLERQDAREAIALMLWQQRFTNPEMTVKITREDIKGLGDCVGYLKATKVVRIFRPQGAPAQEAVAASGKRPAIAARPAIPPRNYVVVQLVDTQGNAIVPVENNDADYDKSQAMAKVRRIREVGPDLAQQCRNDAARGVFSSSQVEELAQMLLAVLQATA